jgi:hypothetical protein
MFMVQFAIKAQLLRTNSAPRPYGDLAKEHASSGSEANGVISNFRQLSPQQKQDLLNFLRSL